MPPTSPNNRFRLILVGLAGACAVVGMLWGLRWAFEDRVLSGRLSPEAALQAMADLVAMLYALAALVATLLAMLLAWIAKRTRETRRWPPSGSWPAPRPLTEEQSTRYARRLHAGLALAVMTAVAALVAALT